MKKSYAYKTLTSIFNESTSGGAFSKIVELFFSKGEGVVYGAILDCNLNVVHDRATTLPECVKFYKSKYVKSNFLGILPQVIQDLGENKRVLFSGTACQIQALKKYIENHRISSNNLYTIDVICNGAPEHNIWNDYKQWLQESYNRRLVYFGFREKGDKLNPYKTKAIFEGGISIVDSCKTACYNRLFLKKLLIPKGCFVCPFKSENRISDISLGDFWGAENIFENETLKYGVSLVLVNTEKGNYLFDINEIDPSDSIVVEILKKEYLPYQLNLLGDSKIPSAYNNFWNDYKKNGFSYIATKYADASFPNSLKYNLRKIYRLLKYNIKDVKYKIKRLLCHI